MGNSTLTPYEQQEGPGGDAGVSEMLAETFAVWAKGGPAAVARRYDQGWADYAHRNELSAVVCLSKAARAVVLINGPNRTRLFPA